MSESDAQTSMGAVAAASAAGTAAAPQPTATSQTVCDDASNWAMAGADVPAVAHGLDLVSGDSGSDDWFPSVAVTAVIAMALATGPDIDPLISLADNAVVAPDSGLDDGASHADIRQTSLDLPNAETHVSALYVLSMPIDHGTPLDHIEWHFTGLLPLI
jgi:hypothetical protein